MQMSKIMDFGALQMVEVEHIPILQAKYTAINTKHRYSKH